MRLKRIGVATLVSALLMILLLFPMDSYISRPGSAYDLTPLVEVDGQPEKETGTFNLMTISISKATLFTYALSGFSNERKLLSADSVRRNGENEEEYNLRQKRLMDNSQFNAISVAFEKANRPVSVELNGVVVMRVLKKGASSTLLKTGDIIRQIDGMPLVKSGDFAERIAKKELGDSVRLLIEREGEEIEVDISLREIPDSDGKVGLGIQFEEDRTITTEPTVKVHTSNIGGPSAGLMFTLEILNRLLEEDITKGYQIAGTGEMLEDGTVGRIGGADFKVMAAAKDGMDIFFAPDDEIPEDIKHMNPGIQTNYEEAKKAAEQIGTSMKIIPVKTIDDALDYLNQLEQK